MEAASSMVGATAGTFEESRLCTLCTCEHPGIKLQDSFRKTDPVEGKCYLTTVLVYCCAY